ncbi:hypothetical protein JZ751_018273 [Albula glossodonta]|uniref:Retinoblastoma-associated protein N-terminal domain-containing protein n=1 Tax=Albula glossodonta TaxID=121402 RepID=A0A8T2NQU5_9TELE|nr:hypothetical protein JZ751_018273 [Albula glossodonta]
MNEEEETLHKTRQRTSVPTVSKGTVEGNYVSLTKILRSSEQSLIEFFSKMRKWQDMASVPQDFRQRTEKLERNFTVSAVIFKKYVPIFQDIFKAPSDDPPRVHRSRKQRRHPCTVSEVFNFCWILFVHAKGVGEGSFVTAANGAAPAARAMLALSDGERQTDQSHGAIYSLAIQGLVQACRRQLETAVVWRRKWRWQNVSKVV